ncbi:hypothetical protein ACYJW8_15715 [Frateuria aurantia]
MLANTATMGDITASYDSTTHVLTLASTSGTATLAQWQAALDAVTFSSNAGASAMARTISFVVNDGTRTSAALERTVSVESATIRPAPTLTTLPPLGRAVAIASGIETASASQVSPLTIESSPLVIVSSGADVGADLNSFTTIETSTFLGLGQPPTTALGSTQVIASSIRALPGYGMKDISVFAGITLGDEADALSADHLQDMAGSLQAADAMVLPRLDLLATSRGDEIAVAVNDVIAGSQVAAGSIMLSQADGRALPSWLHYDKGAGVLVGHPPVGSAREIHLVLVARDDQGHLIRREVVIHLETSPDVSSVNDRGHPVETSLAGKPSLTAQFAAARQQSTARHAP